MPTKTQQREVFVHFPGFFPHSEEERAKFIKQARAFLTAEKAIIREQFEENHNVSRNLKATSELMDMVVRYLFSIGESQYECDSLAAIAVGGYGRQEMAPFSDLDILFLYTTQRGEEAKFMQFIIGIMWDIGLSVSHSFRSLEQCLELAREDTITCTNLLDARFLAGSKRTFGLLQDLFRKNTIEGREEEFIEAKLAEEESRHERAQEIASAMPDIKNGEGSLRDIDTIRWIAQCLHDIEGLEEMVDLNLLSAGELQDLQEARRFFWLTRIWLHYLEGREENHMTEGLAEELGVDFLENYEKMSSKLKKITAPYKQRAMS